jgi:type VII secretion system (Wss) protein ESAT-6
MTLHLTPQEAQTRIHQVDEAMNNLRTLASRILDSTETMTGSSWQGGRAQTFRGIMTQHHDDFNYVITQLTHVAEKGKSDIQTLVSADTA